MNCGQFREIAHDLLRGEEFDPAAVEDAFAHAESCDACNTLVEDEESLTASLRMLAAQHASEEAPPRVATALLGELARKRNSAQPANRQQRLLLTGVAGIAAAVLLIVFLLHRGTAQPPLARTLAKAPQEAVAIPSESRTQPGKDDAPSSNTAASNAAASANSAEDETSAASFVPLSETFDQSSLDDAMIVRVVLSRSALESFGLPASESGDEPVDAELVVSNDGMPQAIRVLGW